MAFECAVNWIPEMSLPSHGPTATLLNSHESRDKFSDHKNDCTLTKKLLEEELENALREEWKFASRVINKYFMWIIISAITSNALYVILMAPSGNLLWINWPAKKMTVVGGGGGGGGGG